MNSTLKRTLSFLVAVLTVMVTVAAAYAEAPVSEYNEKSGEYIYHWDEFFNSGAEVSERGINTVTAYTRTFKQTVDYRSTVHIIVYGPDVPPLWKFVIFEDNKPLAKGDTYRFEYTVSEVTFDRTFVIKIQNILGGYETDDNGNEYSIVLKLKVKNGFFDQFIAFFRGIFGLLPEYTWEIGENV